MVISFQLEQHQENLSGNISEIIRFKVTLRAKLKCALAWLEKAQTEASWKRVG